MGCKKAFVILVAGWLALVSPAWADQTPLQQYSHHNATNKPNIIFVLTDDQDLHMESLAYMPNLQKHLIQQGTFFRHHYCTVALCCPSRASIWTGKAAHNTNVTDVNPPHGGYPKFVSQGFNDAYLPLWLQDAGYSTYYTGKLFNAHSVVNYNKPFVKGWTASEFLLDPYTYEYLNATFQRNHDPPVSYEGQYSTDILIGKALAFLDEALLESESPFFLTVAPTAPHSNVNIKDSIIDNFTEHSVTQAPPIPAARHADLFANVTVPRTPHFNPSQANGVSWISRLPRQNETNLDFNDHFYRSRLRALQPVDELIETLISRLETAGVLDNTYIVYSTDNGYHIGQHRLQPGKQCPFDEDVNIPFVIRGPGVPKNVSTNVVTNHVDLAPTFLRLAGVDANEQHGFDGDAIPLNAVALEEATRQGQRQEHVNIESWGLIMSEGKYGSELHLNHTYKALRVVGEGYSLLYTVWCSGERELYDLIADPYALKNIHQPLLNSSIAAASSNQDSISFYAHQPTSDFSADSKAPPLDAGAFHRSTSSAPPSPHQPKPAAIPIPIPRVTQRLNALLAVLKTCTGHVCTHPWEHLHRNSAPQSPASDTKTNTKSGPDSSTTATTVAAAAAATTASAPMFHTSTDVTTLRQALDSKWDKWYDEYTQDWEFRWCELGYIPEAEVGGPWTERGWTAGAGAGAGAMGLEIDVGALGRGSMDGVEVEKEEITQVGQREEEEEEEEEERSFKTEL